MSNKLSFQKVKGFQDIYGDTCAYWDKAESIFRECMSFFGIGEIRIPILENTSVFNRGIGQTTDIVEKEMFTFTDRDSKDAKGESLSLRPEGTAGVVRAYIENGMFNPPLLKKLYYLGPMFRRERPQKGRFRQFTQGGVEFLGSSSPLADADLINLLITFFKKADLDNLTSLEINSVGCPECRPLYHQKLIDYFASYEEELCEDCKRRLKKNPLRILDCKNEKCRGFIKDAPVMLDSLCGICCEHFDNVKSYLSVLGIDYNINPLMVRGLDYYVRTAFEVVTDKLGAASAVGAGGRYDGLVETLGGPSMPGIGFAVGMDRVVELMKLNNELKSKGTDVFIVTFGGDTLEAGLRLMNNLRENGIAAELDYEVKGMKNQMKQADRSGARYAVIIGEDELKADKVTLRNLSISQQSEVNLNDVIRIIKSC